MSIIVHYPISLLTRLLENLGSMSEVLSERFHQDIKTTRHCQQSRLDNHMMAKVLLLDLKKRLFKE